MQETPQDMVDALAVEICALVSGRRDHLAAIRVEVPELERPRADDVWVRDIESRLAEAGINSVDVILARAQRPGRLVLLGTDFEAA